MAIGGGYRGNGIFGPSDALLVGPPASLHDMVSANAPLGNGWAARFHAGTVTAFAICSTS